MAQMNTLISQRLKKSEPSSKMASLAEKSASGSLSSFHGLFPMSELSSGEKALLEEILNSHALQPDTIADDLKILFSLTAEVKAINHQAALLHGERIKKAQELFIRYKEGAFSAWLMATYGNRQTPYNLLQYFEFYKALPNKLQAKMIEMPRQAIYSLASRGGELSAKLTLVAEYRGETKNEVLSKIRSQFPLPLQDKRRENPPQQVLSLLQKARLILKKYEAPVSQQEKDALKEILQSLLSFLKKA